MDKNLRSKFTSLLYHISDKVVKTLILLDTIQQQVAVAQSVELKARFQSADKNLRSKFTALLYHISDKVVKTLILLDTIQQQPL
ncbi:hypothetical protein FLP15_00960 [Lactococcus protaetiae]|uniref:Uncharacterized protein n=1 Tax=Lactococcus protaetiae TaxID=2592653 RepID=A0A514Z5X4_9LACT|nr:hypothetical protein FLP15_00960 [Lactococcus protaetiae]